jgi:hypothetical protein
VGWQTYLLRFNQQTPDGYRYLDKCGEFMLAAVEKFDLLPSQPTVTGCDLSLPEEGLRITANPNVLEVIQENPGDVDTFLKVSLGMAELMRTHFGPLTLDSTCFEMKLQVPMASEEAAGEAMLKLKSEQLAGLSKTMDMVAESQRIDYTFASGSQRLRLVVQPVAYEAIRLHRHNPVLMATDSQKRRAQRLTKLADRTPTIPPCAIFMEIALMEYHPAPKTEKPLFDLLIKKAELAKKVYTIP